MTDVRRWIAIGASGLLAACGDGNRRVAVPQASEAVMAPARAPEHRWTDFTAGTLRVVAPAGAEQLLGMPALSVGLGRDTAGDFLTVWAVDGNGAVRRARRGAVSGAQGLQLAGVTIHDAVLTVGDHRALTITGALATEELVARFGGTAEARAQVARALGHTPETLPARVAVRVSGVGRD